MNEIQAKIVRRQFDPGFKTEASRSMLGNSVTKSENHTKIVRPTYVDKRAASHAFEHLKNLIAVQSVPLIRRRFKVVENCGKAKARSFKTSTNVRRWQTAKPARNARPNSPR